MIRETLSPTLQPMLARLSSSILVLIGGLPAQDLLHASGPLVTHLGQGFANSDVSALVDVAPDNLSTLGVDCRRAANQAVADDFTVCGTWTIDAFEFFVYRSGSSTTSTITAVHWQVWTDRPGTPFAFVIAGSIATPHSPTTNRFSNVYRAALGTLTDNQQPIMRVYVPVTPPLVLGQRNWWIEFQADASLPGPVACPPVTVRGVRSTGNAVQRTGTTWAVVNNSQTGFPAAGVDFPFHVYGTAVGGTRANAATYGAGKVGHIGIGSWDLGPGPIPVPRLGDGVGFPLRLVYGFPNSPPIVAIGPALQSGWTYPPVGTLYVSPVLATFPMPVFDLGGASTVRLPVPPDHNLCGIVLGLQGVWADPNATAGICHSQGLALTFGY